MPVYPCKWPTCTAYVTNRGDHCPDHAHHGSGARERNQFYDQHHRNLESKAFYNSAAWQRARAIKLRNDPVCERCRRVFAWHVHHKMPLEKCTPSQKLDQRNLFSACLPCHNAIEAEARRSELYVQMTTHLATAADIFVKDEIHDVESPIGEEWVRKGIALESATPPPHIAELLARLEDGHGRPVIFLPFLGEFGHLVMSHLRIVHFHCAADKVVCCRPGEEVLFPSARAFTDWIDPTPDAERVGTNRNLPSAWPQIEEIHPDRLALQSGHLSPIQEVSPIHPDRPIPFQPRRRGLRADVVLGVRCRDFRPERNWSHWQPLADALRAFGYTFAVVGSKPTSFNVHGQTVHSGDLDTDAAIELIQNCKLYIGTDSGGSHLASTIGANMLLFRETRGGSRDLIWRMKRVNPRPTEVVADGWTEPKAVIQRAIEVLGGLE